MAALLADLPVDVPGITVNRLCASGLDAVGMAARAIRAGDCALMLAGGVESMSRAPFVMPKTEAAFARTTAVYDTTIGWRFVNPKMDAAHGHTFHAGNRRSRGRRVERVARGPRCVLRYAHKHVGPRHRRRGALWMSCARSEVPQRKGTALVIDRDEHPRPDTSADALAKLRGDQRA